MVGSVKLWLPTMVAVACGVVGAGRCAAQAVMERQVSARDFPVLIGGGPRIVSPSTTCTKDDPDSAIYSCNNAIKRHQDYIAQWEKQLQQTKVMGEIERFTELRDDEVHRLAAAEAELAALKLQRAVPPRAAGADYLAELTTAADLIVIATIGHASNIAPPVMVRHVIKGEMPAAADAVLATLRAQAEPRFDVSGIFFFRREGAGLALLRLDYPGAPPESHLPVPPDSFLPAAPPADPLAQIAADTAAILAMPAEAVSDDSNGVQPPMSMVTVPDGEANAQVNYTMRPASMLDAAEAAWQHALLVFAAMPAAAGRSALQAVTAHGADRHGRVYAAAALLIGGDISGLGTAADYVAKPDPDSPDTSSELGNAIARAKLPPEAEAFVRNAAVSPDILIRAAAVSRLSGFHTAACDALLEKALTDPSPYVSAAAKRSQTLSDPESGIVMPPHRHLPKSATRPKNTTPAKGN